MENPTFVSDGTARRPRRRRRAGVLAFAALVSAGTFAALPAMSHSATPAVAQSPETDQVGCAGVSGYDSTGTWQFQQLGLMAGEGCKIYSPDNFNPTAPSPPPTPVIPPTVTPPTLCDPSGGVGSVLCDAFAVENSVCSAEQDDCNWATNAVFGLVFGSPVFSSFANVTLSGTGNLFCGNGTLSGTGHDGNGPEADFDLVWTATFTNYVGTVTGTATSDGSPTDDPSDAAGTVKQLTGTIVVEDGPQADTPLGIGIGDCTDSFAGQNPTVMNLTYTG